MSTTKSMLLLENASATGSGVFWPGGVGTFHVVGTFGGSTITLQRLGPDNATWTDVGSDVILTDEGMGNFELGEGQIRAEIVGGSPSGIYAGAAGVSY